MQRVTQEEFWAKIPHWVLTHPNLDAYAVRVYCVLSKHASKERNAYPGVRLIAEEAHCSTNTVLRVLIDLETLGAITIFKESHGKRPKVNRYHLPMFRVSSGETSTAIRVSSSGPYVSRDETSDVSRGETELDLKNQLTRELEKSKPEIPPRLPGESRAAHAKRIADTN